ncbi:MAG: hypothetical protein ACD_50C00052G0008 [uncultured bacterium]|nr:MAG: hypothetical protein ACD_50C00052G0008 [uncultured bacterium]OGH14063.1 MAG: hypothetical protein A2687_02250 [Candidatus Levybacteria bacterium RIFCSPHIGHO2_01_FULL_38_26]
MDIFAQIVEKIIREQEGIIGPVALEQARKVQGLNVDWEKHDVRFDGDQKTIVERLVGQYRELFGQASVEVCKDAVKDVLSKIPQDQRPQLLL